MSSSLTRVLSLQHHLSSQSLSYEGEAVSAAAGAGGGAKTKTKIKGLSMTGSLRGRTLLITGASRGIGLSIALEAARDGANVAILAKTTEPHPKLPGTIYTAAKAVEDAGGKALPIKVDIRDEEAVKAAVEQVVAKFGGIDVLVNNASAISLTGTSDTALKRYDLMHSINGRGTFLCGKYCLPHLQRSSNPHILTISPPLSLEPRWFGPHVAYTISKFNMSLLTLGWAEEFKDEGIAVNSLWPMTAVNTSAVSNLMDSSIVRCSRTPNIMGEAAYEILRSSASELTGQFLIDEDVLRAAGVEDFTPYNVDPSVPQSDLTPDLFV